MQFFETLLEKWKAFCGKARPVFAQIGHILTQTGNIIAAVGRYIAKMRKVILAVPVGAAAVLLALYNESHLPEIVGLDLQSNGEFSIEIIREFAVLGPIAITAACLLLMFISRRTLTPWFVSLVSLALPVIILVTNIFPA